MAENPTQRTDNQQSERQQSDKDKYRNYAQESSGNAQRNAEGVEETQDDLGFDSRDPNREPYSGKTAREVGHGAGRVQGSTPEEEQKKK